MKTQLKRKRMLASTDISNDTEALDFIAKFESFDVNEKRQLLKELLSKSDQATLSIISCLVLPTLKMNILVFIY
jgi:DNA-directed RNA polymerase subunit F